jgi:hypothetical protein
VALKDASPKRQPEPGHDPENFFAGETPIHEKEMHPQTVISMLKEELRRSQAHIQQLYRRIAELTGEEDGPN